MSNTVFPILVLIAFGIICGIVFHRKQKGFWKASILSAAVAGVLWVVGAILIMLITAPQEAMNGMSDIPIAFKAFVMSTLVALPITLLSGYAIRKLHRAKRASV